MTSGRQAHVPALLKAGADPMALSDADPEVAQGQTILMHAAGNGHAEAVEALWAALPQDRREAATTATDDYGNTALHYAAAAHDRVTYDVLVEAGFDPALPNEAGNAPEDILAS